MRAHDKSDCTNRTLCLLLFELSSFFVSSIWSLTQAFGVQTGCRERDQTLAIELSVNDPLVGVGRYYLAWYCRVPDVPHPDFT